MYQQISDLTLSRVDRALEADDFDTVWAILQARHPSIILAVLRHIPTHQRQALYHLFDDETLAEILPIAGHDIAHEILAELSENTLGEIIGQMDSDDATDVLQWLDDEGERQRILRHLPVAEQKQLRELLRFDEYSAGGIMQKEFFAVPAKWTVRRVMEKLRRFPDDLENIHEIYLVDNRLILNGIVPIFTLLRMQPEQPVIEGAVANPISVEPHMEQEAVALLFRQYNLASMPVVDELGHILGRITADDIFYVLEEEATEDLYRMASLSEDTELEQPYRKTVVQRSSWLMINLGFSTLTSLVVSLFEDSITRMAALAILMPIIANVSGVGGIQTFTIVVRGMALGQIDIKEGQKVLRHQAWIGLGNGAIIGTVLALVTWWRFESPMLGVVIALAMFSSLLIAGIFGAFIPLAMRWLNFDPPLASGLVTTVTDISAFFIFLGLATLILLH